MEHTYFFAVDLGATSGRTILGCLGEGKMELKELTRFPNHIIEPEDIVIGIFTPYTMKLSGD